MTDEEGVRVHRVRSTTQRLAGANQTGRPYLPPIPDPDVVRALAAIVDEERPQIVHAHNWMIHSFLPLKSTSGARVVMTLHDYGVACAKKSLIWHERPCSGPGFTKCLHCAARHYGTARGELITLGNWATRWPLRGAVDTFLPVSAAVARGNELDEMGVRYEVVHNFVPDDVANEGADDPATASTNSGKLPQEPYWLYVGTLSQHKGVGVLLEAYESVSRCSSAGANRPPLCGRSAQLSDRHHGPVRPATSAGHGRVAPRNRWICSVFVPGPLPDRRSRSHGVRRSACRCGHGRLARARRGRRDRAAVRCG